MRKRFEMQHPDSCLVVTIANPVDMIESAWQAFECELWVEYPDLDQNSLHQFRAGFLAGIGAGAMLTDIATREELLDGLERVLTISLKEDALAE